MLPGRFGLLLVLASSLILGCASRPERSEVAVASSAARCPAGVASACFDLFQEPRENQPLRTPAERFFSRLDRMESAFKELEKYRQEGRDELLIEDRAKLIQAFSDDNVRSMALQIQELQEMYIEIYDLKGKKKKRELLENQYARMREFEGVLGAYMRSQELYKRTLGSTRLDDKIKADIANRADKAGTTMIDALRKLDWTSDPAAQIAEFRREIKELRLKGRQKDKRLYVEAMLGRLREMEKAIKKRRGYFETSRFTAEQMEEGVHYVRRRLRETVMMISTADGIFKFINDHQRPDEMKIYSAYAHKGYESLPTLKNPVEIPLYLAYQAEFFVGKLGELKDFKESQFDLTEVLREHGYNEHDAEAKAFEVVMEYFENRNKKEVARAAQEQREPRLLVLPTEMPIELQAAEFYRKIESSEFFKNLRKRLEEWLKKSN